MSTSVVRHRLRASSQGEVFDALAQALAEAGVADSAYASDLLSREGEYPTGLAMKYGTLAIPHADSAHVHMNGCAFATLAEPVSFEEMGKPGSAIQVDNVLCLALADKDAYAATLGALLRHFQQQETFEELSGCSSESDLQRWFESVPKPD